MSKAEEKAKEFLEKLASHTTLYKGTIDELEVYEPDDVIWAYKEGYYQAEKDLKLAWKDIALIESISKEFIKNNTTPMTDKDYYQEVLKQFKEIKKK